MLGLVAAGALVDAGNGDRMTPLRIAIASGHEAVVELLVRLGADVLRESDDVSVPRPYLLSDIFNCGFVCLR